jgi:hypothetical protein
LIVDDIIRAGKKREIEENQAKYAQMSPQQMADGKDNVVVFYEHVLNVTVKEKRFLEMEFVFCRMQKLDGRRLGSTLGGRLSRRDREVSK